MSSLFSYDFSTRNYFICPCCPNRTLFIYFLIQTLTWSHRYVLRVFDVILFRTVFFTQ